MRPALPSVLLRLCLICLPLGLPLPGRAQTPELMFPAPANATASSLEPMASYRLPIGPWGPEGVPSRLVEGTVEQTAWRIAAPLSTLDLMAPLRRQLQAEGWQVIYDCETAACGGYDFRYSLPLMTEPDMHVDLGDFRYLAAGKGAEVLSLMVSRSQVSGFVQMTRVSPEPSGGAVVPPQPTDPVPGGPALYPTPAQGDFAVRLERAGSLVLEDLVFASGAGELAAGDYASLVALAGYLSDHPARRIALVGHTDASGGLPGNIALSEARAASVRKALIALGVAGDRIEAKGVGYLAPRASNLTPEGQTQNRRVEVMLISAE